MGVATDMLYSERKRLREIAEREARGESFWTNHFDEKVRQKLLYSLTESAERDLVMTTARYLILKAEGLPYLDNGSAVPAFDFQLYALGCPDEMMPTVIEAMLQALVRLSQNHPVNVPPPAVIEFRNQLTALLQDHRIS
jgi:hypothetical protein